ncbi:MAG: LytTR family transcriptional regulator DNA-binding domain-containing protein [Taibaiella sp.]|nr:LytTR family transcriptional regulator DNA-binding domain-containing protein [Taibaiella sp.]
MKERPDRPLYKDEIFRPAACLLAAHVIVMMGRPDLTTFEAFEKPSYYPTVAINYIIALLVGWTVKKVTIALDKRHPWYKDIWRRAMLQFAFGVLAVSILSYLLVLIYFVAFGQDIIKSGYLHYELPFSIALITILNFYYVATYFYLYPRPKPSHDDMELIPVIEKTQKEDVEEIPVTTETTYTKIDVVEEVRSYAFSVMTPDGLGLIGNKKEGKEIFIIDTPKRSIPVKVEDVIMFFIYEKTAFVRLKGINSLNDCYTIKLSLMDVMALLDESNFYRINRQCIIALEVIGAYEPSANQTLLITLKKEHGKLENIDSNDWTKLVTVSEDRATDFKKWLNR